MNIQEAAECLNCSQKQIRRYIAKGELHPKYLKQPGKSGKAPAVFDQEEVLSLKERIYAPLYKPRIDVEVLPSVITEEIQINHFQEVIAAAKDFYCLQGLKLKLLLNLDEAKIISGLSKSEILEAVKTGAIAGRRTGLGWRLSQQSLDDYCISSCLKDYDRGI